MTAGRELPTCAGAHSTQKTRPPTLPLARAPTFPSPLVALCPRKWPRKNECQNQKLGAARARSAPVPVTSRVPHIPGARTEIPRAPTRARAPRGHSPDASPTPPGDGAGVRALRSRSRPSPRPGMRSAGEEPRARRPRPPPSPAPPGGVWSGLALFVRFSVWGWRRRKGATGLAGGQGELRPLPASPPTASERNREEKRF